MSVRKVIAAFLGLFVIAFVSVAAVRADAQTETNVQDGENTSDTRQTGRGQAGDAITGQVTGVSSSGPASVDATNRSEDSTAQTGHATGRNSATSRTGLSVSKAGESDSPSSETTISNSQTGDNRTRISQSASAVTGDGVGGQVIGVVAGGPSRIVASNLSRNVDVITGDATADNDAAAFVGLDISGVSNTATDFGCFEFCEVLVAATATVTAGNEQEGDNRGRIRQSARAHTGDGVGGQVIGAVTTNGSSSIDATNTSQGVSVTTGDADANNDGELAVGLNVGDITNSATAEGCVFSCEGFVTAFASATVANSQEGDNRGDLDQSASATSGDGVAGQVIGAVTTRGSSSIAAANTSRDSDVTTGDADASNSGSVFVGLDVSGITNADSATGCFIGCSAVVTATAVLDISNDQDGDNRGDLDQTARAATGDGVGGQVIGAITSGGSSSIDARNTTDGVSVTTGNADADNDGDMFVGLHAGEIVNTATAEGCFAVCAATVTVAATATVTNTQVGDNRGRLSQSANASSGDGVGGQVIGAVTSGGSSSIAAANTTRDSDVTTGDADASNNGTVFVGLDASGITNTDSATGCFVECLVTVTATADLTVANDQTGDNRGRVRQSANASTGDGVGGQVIGAVTSGGSSSIDARNRTDNVIVQTGDSDATNNAAVFVGLQIASVTATATAFGCFIGCEALVFDAATLTVSNVQVGDNDRSTSQTANASSGDAVGGQVIGAVTSGGGTSVVIANTSTDVVAESGDGNESNNESSFVGLFVGGSVFL